MTVVVHADWSRVPGKRSMARARIDQDGWRAGAPELVPDTRLWVPELIAEAGRSEGTVVVGFDFPIGVPRGFARNAQAASFTSLLRERMANASSTFFELADKANQISVERPFYPYRPGGTSMDHLCAGLGLVRAELLRRCERKHPDRGAASPLFWTLGAKQVGRAAIAGWREVIAPALAADEDVVRLWPFDGPFESLCEPGRLVLVETYPAEFYAHFDFPRGGWSKRRQVDRAARAIQLRDWANTAGVHLETDLGMALDEGFGGASLGLSSDAAGEDAFDAVVGLFGMLNTIAAPGPVPIPPDDPKVTSLEGWIFGQAG